MGVTTCNTGLNNYFMYMGGEGLYTHTVEYERDPGCLSCSAGLPCVVPPGTPLQALIDMLMQDGRLEGKLKGPSLAKTMENLMGGTEGVLSLNDKGLKAPVRV